MFYLKNHKSKRMILFSLFIEVLIEKDASLIEINPLILDKG